MPEGIAADVARWKATGRGWQTRMADALALLRRVEDAELFIKIVRHRFVSIDALIIQIHLQGLKFLHDLGWSGTGVLTLEAGHRLLQTVIVSGRGCIECLNLAVRREHLGTGSVSATRHTDRSWWFARGKRGAALRKHINALSIGGSSCIRWWRRLEAGGLDG